MEPTWVMAEVSFFRRISRRTSWSGYLLLLERKMEGLNQLFHQPTA